MDVLDFQRLGQTQDNHALQQLARGLMFVPAEYYEVVFQAGWHRSVRWTSSGSILWREVEAYRISNRVKAFLPVTEWNGLNDDSIARELGVGAKRRRTRDQGLADDKRTGNAGPKSLTLLTPYSNTRCDQEQ